MTEDRRQRTDVGANNNSPKNVGSGHALPRRKALSLKLSFSRALSGNPLSAMVGGGVPHLTAKPRPSEVEEQDYKKSSEQRSRRSRSNHSGSLAVCVRNATPLLFGLWTIPLIHSPIHPLPITHHPLPITIQFCHVPSGQTPLTLSWVLLAIEGHHPLAMVPNRFLLKAWRNDITTALRHYVTEER